MTSWKFRKMTSEEMVYAANNLDGFMSDDSDLDKDFVPCSTDSECDSLQNSFVLGRSQTKSKKKVPATDVVSVPEPPNVPVLTLPEPLQAASAAPVHSDAVPGPSGIKNKKRKIRDRSESPIPVLNTTTIDEEESDSDYPESEDSFQGFVEDEIGIPPPVEMSDILWFNDDMSHFKPKYTFPNPREGKVLLLDAKTPLQIFHSLFTPEMIEKIALHTNERIDLYLKSHRGRGKSSAYKKTSSREMQIFLAIIIIMGVNKLPDLHSYWSKMEGLGNSLIKRLMSRDRFCFLHSRLYMESPAKPPNASKTYYLEKIVQDLLKNFRESYGDSAHQSIDEAMVAFKGRSAMKQYMPAKPTKRGIKLWQRNYASTGYTYDLSIYCGRTGKFTCSRILHCSNGFVFRSSQCYG